MWCTAWWTSGPPAKPAPRWASKRRALFDLLDPLEKRKNAILAERGITGGTAMLKTLRQVQKDAIEFLRRQAARAGGTTL